MNNTICKLCEMKDFIFAKSGLTCTGKNYQSCPHYKVKRFEDLVRNELQKIKNKNYNLKNQN